MTTRRGFLAAFAAIAVLPVAAVAGPKWVVLGRRQVHLVADHDRIAVNGRGGPYRRLRLEVRRNGIMVETLRVTFSNGEHETLEVRAFIEQGGHTRDIDLPGGPREISHIDMTYARRPGGGVAVVTALGLAA